MGNVSIYDKQYNYGQVKAICKVFKYREELAKIWGGCADYEDIIDLALDYYSEWELLANLRNNKNTTSAYNKIGNKIEFISEEEFAYEQSYIDRRIKEDYIL